MTWNVLYKLWMNEELKFEGELWQELNRIVVILDELEKREGQDDEYTILKEEAEYLKAVLLNKYS